MILRGEKPIAADPVKHLEIGVMRIHQDRPLGIADDVGDFFVMLRYGQNALRAIGPVRPDEFHHRQGQNPLAGFLQGGVKAFVDLAFDHKGAAQNCQQPQNHQHNRNTEGYLPAHRLHDLHGVPNL